MTLPSLQPLADRLSVSRIVRRKKLGVTTSEATEKISHLPWNPVNNSNCVPNPTPPSPERVSTKTSSPDDSAADQAKKRKKKNKKKKKDLTMPQGM